MCVDALKPFGDVLQVGFSSGAVAERIQFYRPKSHTIIEPDVLALEKARGFAKGRENIILIGDTWQRALPKLRQFDALFFDSYSISAPIKESFAFLQEGSEKMKKIENQLAFLKGREYIEEDIESFFSLLDKNPPVTPKYLFRFLGDLKRENSITLQQLQKALIKMEQKGWGTSKQFEEWLREERPEAPLQKEDPLYPFLEECLRSHMKKGSRFSAAVLDSVSKYEDKKFFNLVIVDPFLEYKEELITAPSGEKALVLTITKL